MPKEEYGNLYIKAFTNLITALTKTWQGHGEAMGSE
jgi:hypothetical protein